MDHNKTIFPLIQFSFVGEKRRKDRFGVPLRYHQKKNELISCRNTVSLIFTFHHTQKVKVVQELLN